MKTRSHTCRHAEVRILTETGIGYGSILHGSSRKMVYGSALVSVQVNLYVCGVDYYWILRLVDYLFVYCVQLHLKVSYHSVLSLDD
jgi:hypothetical protein